MLGACADDLSTRYGFAYRRIRQVDSSIACQYKVAGQVLELGRKALVVYSTGVEGNL
jgi:hypothetical protein